MCVSGFFLPLAVFILALFPHRPPPTNFPSILRRCSVAEVCLLYCVFFSVAATVVLFSLTGVSNLLLIEMFVYLPSNLYSLCGSKGQGRTSGGVCGKGGLVSLKFTMCFYVGLGKL